MNVDDLIDADDSGIVLVREWAGRSNANPNIIFPADRDRALESLPAIGVTTRSILGAIVFETGGVAIAGGLVRLWGSGPDRSLLEANHHARAAAGQDLADILLIADDAFGGLFALNGGGLAPLGHGDVCHLPADATQWHSLDVGYSDFVAWCLGGDLALLYGSDSGTALSPKVAFPPFDLVSTAYPFPWTVEGQNGCGSVREIDADEHLRLRIELLGFAPDIMEG